MLLGCEKVTPSIAVESAKLRGGGIPLYETLGNENQHLMKIIYVT